MPSSCHAFGFILCEIGCHLVSGGSSGSHFTSCSTRGKSKDVGMSTRTMGSTETSFPVILRKALGAEMKEV